MVKKILFSLLCTLAFALSAIEVPNGTLEFMAWKNREKYPQVEEIEAMTYTEKTKTYSKAKTRIKFEQGKYVVISDGKNSNSEVFAWAPALVFKATTAGKYELQAQIEGAGKTDGEYNMVVVFIITTNHQVIPIYKKVISNKDKLSLTEELKNSPFMLNDGDKLVLSIWRNKWHDWGAGRVGKFKVVASTNTTDSVFNSTTPVATEAKAEVEDEKKKLIQP